jgi:hypothetical protein
VSSRPGKRGYRPDPQDNQVDAQLFCLFQNSVPCVPGLNKCLRFTPQLCFRRHQRLQACHQGSFLIIENWGRDNVHKIEARLILLGERYREGKCGQGFGSEVDRAQDRVNIRDTPRFSRYIRSDRKNRTCRLAEDSFRDRPDQKLTDARAPVSPKDDQIDVLFFRDGGEFVPNVALSKFGLMRNRAKPPLKLRANSPVPRGALAWVVALRRELKIPHTLAETTLGALAPGDEVNLEADVIAKYVERLLPTSTMRP